MPLAPGTWLNQYEVLSHIGSGGMGDVYHARDSKLEREVALKLLPEHFARDPERIIRLRQALSPEPNGLLHPVLEPESG
ncbi:MAG: hypothetical protein A3H28_15600 [Acidobacteria bacterium RIFCSPLOWO2_02_FULL_61_28]|nr:MAG: hypothetical protein A3H28_15600 [Acidobacteria bacterium RIFCSPLOWO2_02_FULL_61_28]